MSIFENAFNFVMSQEIGPSWNINDPDVINGLNNTPAQRKKIGYVNNPFDTGGLTVYGISQKNNTDIDVLNLNLSRAQDIYYTRYWSAGRCASLPAKVGIIHFDTCVNSGVTQANKLLQKSVDANPDGVIGNITFGKIQNMPESAIVQAYLKNRSDFVKDIVQNKPTQGRFLSGWLNRIDALGKYVQTIR